MRRQKPEKEPDNRPVTLRECKTIIKALYKPKQTKDSYRNLSRKDQVNILTQEWTQQIDQTHE